MIRSATALSAGALRAKAQERAPPKALSPSGVDALYLSLENDGVTAMAMTMNGQVQLPASREVVWAKLNDPEVLKSCIPGSEQFEKISESEFQAVATVKVGPVKARWKGKVRLSDLDPPNGYRISGEGEGGAAGFAKGGAKVSLSDKDGGTLLTYDVEAQIGGKLAQLGQRLINSAAKKTADDFFVKFAAAVTQPQ
jgi:carbon monoxide dehydrogenase subunit G